MGNADVPPELALVDAGLDSVTAVELRNQLQDAFKMKLPTTLVYDHPTRGLCHPSECVPLKATIANDYDVKFTGHLALHKG